MTDSSLIFDVRDGVAWLSMNRPGDLNAISLDMVERFEQCMPEVLSDDTIKALVITGLGKAFCAGADLKQVVDSLDVPPGEPDFLDRLCDRVMNPLRDFPKPVIAALNGLTMAGGLELAMCADLVVAAQSARIGDAHANFGVYPGAGGAAVLPRIVPHNVAKYLLFTGKTLSAEEMKHYGFVNEVVADHELQQATQDLALHIAEKSPIALQRMKAVANGAADKTRDDALRHEMVEFRRHQRSWDMAEGLAAFAEKRKPEFQGR